MTALYMDGFDHYGTGSIGNTNMLSGAWVAGPLPGNGGPATPSWGASRTGTYALNSTGGSVPWRYVLPSGKGEVLMSFGFACDALPSGNFAMPICSFNDGSNAIIAKLWCQSTGQIVLADISNNVLAATQGPAITAENWHFLEMDFKISGGDFTLRVDDPSGAATAAIAATGLSLGASNVAQLTFIGTGGTPTPWIDDLFIRDASGSVNNGFLGDRRVFTSLVDGDTATAGWTPNYYHQLGAGILNNTATNACVGAATATSLNVGSGDFTLEGFIRFKTLPTGSNKSVIFGKWDETNNQRSYQLFYGGPSLNSSSLQFRTSTDGTNSTVANPIVYPWTPALNTWYHIAVVRASSEDLLFVNGQQFGLPIADSNTYFAGTAPFGLGGQIEGTATVISNAEMDGWFDEVRFTNGFARYTTNFTPTTVEFPRNVGGDPEFADVAILAGFDSIIQDESSFARTLTSLNGAVQQTTNDGPAVGAWSTIGKSVPDDNTFIEAPFLAATGILTVTVNPGNTNTVTVGTTDGSTPAVYTFKTSISTAFDVLIDTNIQNSLQNLYNAINAGPGSGTKYGTGTTANFDVFATQLPAGQMQVTANIAGTAGNSIASTKSGLTGSWAHTTLTGGAAIPGPSNFPMQRLPPTTTIISAIQISMRGFKSDAGLGSINSALVGPLGGVSTSPTHSLTTSVNYYNDIHETDPDTSGPISPTTITNGSIQVNRDT